MRRLSLALLLAAFALPALADPPPPPPPPAPAPAAQAPLPPKKLEGVVVEGKRRAPIKKCGEKDTVCLAAVMTELKTRYPEQLKVWCFRQKMDEMRNHVNAAAMADPSDPAQGGAGYSISQAAVIKTVCTQAK